MVNQISESTALVEALTTHALRSEDQIRNQQFSAPADLAALAVVVALIHATDIVLEPSAGHGALVATLPEVDELHLNGLVYTISPIGCGMAGSARLPAFRQTR